MANRIKLTKNLDAIVDDQDYEWLSKINWQAHRDGNKYYAQHRIKGGHESMQTTIMQPPKGLTVDHINGNSLDNRRSNLRLATQQEQCWNRNKRKDSKNKYKGVAFYKPTQKWHAYICKNRKQIHLGYFFEENEAAYAYDRAALKLFGEFANFNLTIREIELMIEDLEITRSAMKKAAAERFSGKLQEKLF